MPELMSDKERRSKPTYLNDIDELRIEILHL